MFMKPMGIAKIICFVLLCLLFVQAVPAVGELSVSGGKSERIATDSDINAAGSIMSLSDMTLFFVPNEGQADSGVLFTSKGDGYTISFAQDRVGYSLPYDDGSISGRYVVIQRFSGGNPDPLVVGMDPKETLVSYFTGDESEWHTNITPFHAIVYKDIFPGIDLIYRSVSGSVKREFLVRPGADPYRIRMTYEGAGQIRVTGEGGLVIKAGSGEIRETAPVCYQDKGSVREEIPCRFDIREDGSVSFLIGEHDPSLLLTIDPALAYCGYVGGAGNDTASAIAVDTEGNAYITGTTTSTHDTFPEEGGLDWNYNGDEDAFIAKVDASGTDIVYCGYIGGTREDEGRDIAVDAEGNAYITGFTSSLTATFPDKGGPDPTYNGGEWDAFVAKVNAAGSDLDYCGYIGGDGRDLGLGIAVDTAGCAFVTGFTNSTEDTFPEGNGLDLTLNGFYDAFVAKVQPDGSGLIFCGYIGGNDITAGYDIALDTVGNAFITGHTTCDDGLPITTAALDPTFNGGMDVFVAIVNTGYGLSYCSYFGGDQNENGDSIATDGVNVYITGYTCSNETTFTVNNGPDLSFNGGWSDAFVAKMRVAGTGPHQLVYSGFIGGSGDDYGDAIVRDADGNAYVTGSTGSDQTTFPVRAGPDITYNDGNDAFIAKVNRTGTALYYCGYIGGSGRDVGLGIALDHEGSPYITGFTESSTSTFPKLAGPDLGYNGAEDAFVAKVWSDYGRGVFRTNVTWNWILDRSMDLTTDIRDHFGMDTDYPVMGDINNDEIADRAAFRSGEWIVDNGIDGTVDLRDEYGMAGDIPLIYDFNADGITDRAVFRAGEWIIDHNFDGTSDNRPQYGMAGDIPLVGDFNNDGTPDRAVFRSSVDNNWIIDYSGNGVVDEREHYGNAGDVPLICDFNADGITDRAVFRAGEWIIDLNMDGSVDSRPWYGIRGDRPLVWNP